VQARERVLVQALERAQVLERVQAPEQVQALGQVQGPEQVRVQVQVQVQALERVQELGQERERVQVGVSQLAPKPDRVRAAVITQRHGTCASDLGRSTSRRTMQATPPIRSKS
jgi:hypothetical protein